MNILILILSFWKGIAIGKLVELVALFAMQYIRSTPRDEMS
jgi:hypothetical protein